MSGSMGRGYADAGRERLRRTERPSHPIDGPIAVLGAGGQVGRALAEVLGVAGIALTRAQLDLLDRAGALQTLERIQPAAVINAAAYTAVDRAETEEVLAFRVNGEAPGYLARWCRDRDIPFVHFSTDYVFSGEGARPWTEADPPAPVSVYGRSKLEGERQIAAAGGRWLIVRTSWVYDEQGGNFLTTILRLAAERETISVVNDQRGAPTYAPQLAGAVVTAFSEARNRPAFPSGIYHLCHAGETTWYEFACAIVAAARTAGRRLALRSVVPVTSAEYAAPARRPLNSRLSTAKAAGLLGVALPAWQSGLAECMQRIH
jgi:dTDP-4-dehydrorhamnose reductase